MVKAAKQTLGFQTEVKHLLHLMIHSLYSNKEIFLRELISNSNDAADKLRFEAITHPDYYETDTELSAAVEFDQPTRTLRVSDNGIGMSQAEVIENLGTIAKSGTREFLATLSGDQAKDAKLIGQFGVGFYSAFIVADQVTVETRRAGLPSTEGVRWQSSGDGEFTVETIEKAGRGTTVSLHLREGEDEFLEDWRLRSIIHKYSDHITLAVLMKKQSQTKDGQPDTDASKSVEWEKVNSATALWTLSKNQIKEEEYQAFYKHLSHDFEDPLIWSHNRVEGKQEYITLLYIPARAPFNLWHPDKTHGLKLYVNRVFIMDDAEQFLPRYLRFIKGIIDSNDLPLNISREILQSNKLVEAIRIATTKRVLDLLTQLAKENTEKYQQFWNEFGNVFKEGAVEDFSNLDTIANLLRFASTHTDNKTQTVSLEAYTQRMKPKQKKIYYIIADSFAGAQHSPHLELLRKQGVEVLLLYDRIDEWLVAHLKEFNGKSLQSAAKGDLDIVETDQKSKPETPEKDSNKQNFLADCKKILGDRVKEVRASKRLIDSPACVVTEDNAVSGHMQRLLKAAGQAVPASQPILELNLEHPLIQRLKGEQDDARLAEWVIVLFEQSVLAEGGQLEDPAGFVNRLNKLLLTHTA